MLGVVNVWTLGCYYDEEWGGLVDDRPAGVFQASGSSFFFGLRPLLAGSTATTP